MRTEESSETLQYAADANRADKRLSRSSLLLYAVVASVAGLLAVVVPAVVHGDVEAAPLDVSCLVGGAIEAISLTALACLFAATFLICAFSRAVPWLTAVASVAAFPLCMLIEIISNPSSHNLWPFECLVYASLLIPAACGSMAGWGLRLALSGDSPRSLARYFWRGDAD